MNTRKPKHKKAHSFGGFDPKQRDNVAASLTPEKDRDKGKDKLQDSDSHDGINSKQQDTIEAARKRREKGKDKLRDSDSRKLSATNLTVSYRDTDGYFATTNTEGEGQNAILRECSNSNVTFQGKSLVDFAKYKSLNEQDKALFAKREPILLSFMAKELYDGDETQAALAYSGLNTHYSQYPVNTNVIDTIQKAASARAAGSDVFVDFEYEVDMQSDEQGETYVVTTFHIAGLKKPPVMGDQSTADKFDTTLNYEGTITQRTLLVKNKNPKNENDLFKGLQRTSLVINNPNLETLYLEGANEEEKHFYLLNKNVTLLNALCETHNTPEDINLVKSAQKIIRVMANLGATKQNLSLFNAIVNYASELLKNTEYKASYIDEFNKLENDITLSSISSNEKNTLLAALNELNYQRFSKEMIGLQNLFASIGRKRETLKKATLNPKLPTEETNKAKTQLKQFSENVLPLILAGHNVVSTAKDLIPAGKNCEDLPLYTDILYKTKIITESVANQITTPEDNTLRPRLQQVMKEYKKDTVTLKAHPHKLARFLSEAMERLQGCAMLALASVGMAFGSLATGFSPNAAESLSSANQLAQRGHALLFKPLPKEKETKHQRLGKTMHKYASKVKTHSR